MKKFSVSVEQKMRSFAFIAMLAAFSWAENLKESRYNQTSAIVPVPINGMMNKGLLVAGVASAALTVGGAYGLSKLIRKTKKKEGKEKSQHEDNAEEEKKESSEDNGKKKYQQEEPYESYFDSEWEYDIDDEYSTECKVPIDRNSKRFSALLRNAREKIDKAEIERRENPTETRSIIEIALAMTSVKFNPNILLAFEIILTDLVSEDKENAYVDLFTKAMEHKCKPLIDTILERYAEQNKLNEFWQSVFKSAPLKDLTSSSFSLKMRYILDTIAQLTPETASLFARGDIYLFQNAIEKASGEYDWDLAVDTAIKFKSKDALYFLYEELPSKLDIQKLGKIWFGATIIGYKDLLLRIQKDYDSNLIRKIKAESRSLCFE